MDGANNTMRLQRFLARAGNGGRRHCEQMILDGRVSVNGKTIAEMGVQVDPMADEIRLDGIVQHIEPERVLIALNKPAGVMTTMKDQVGRPCVADFLPMAQYPALYHIGRLDRDTTGILLFTTDGNLGNDLLHPSKHVTKEYIAQVKGTPTEAELDLLRHGVQIRRGERTHTCAPAEADLLPMLPARFKRQESCLDERLAGTSFVRLRIHEGINHQVKLMLGAIGHKVLNLHRSEFGGISCGKLAAGEWRMLTQEEAQSLDRS